MTRSYPRIELIHSSHNGDLIEAAAAASSAFRGPWNDLKQEHWWSRTRRAVPPKADWLAKKGEHRNAILLHLYVSVQYFSTWYCGGT